MKNVLDNVKLRKISMLFGVNILHDAIIEYMY